MKELWAIGLDLGQAKDYTALALVQKVKAEGEYEYHVRGLERFNLGTSYPAIVDRVTEVYSKMRDSDRTASIVVDATGVGAPIVDMLKARRLPLTSITITGGDAVTCDEKDRRHYRVPKRDLVSTLQVLLQTGRLKVAEGIREAKTLVKELLSFQVKIDPKTAHDSYAAWREGTHDDLVLSVSLASWFAVHHLVDYGNPREWAVVGTSFKPTGAL